MVKSTCVISGDNGSAIKGILHLSQASEEAPTIIKGEIKGLTSNSKHAITVNVFGDLSDGCISCGGIFNPFGTLFFLPSKLNIHLINRNEIIYYD